FMVATTDGQTCHVCQTIARQVYDMGGTVVLIEMVVIDQYKSIGNIQISGMGECMIDAVVSLMIVCDDSRFIDALGIGHWGKRSRGVERKSLATYLIVLVSTISISVAVYSNISGLSGV
ncbi:hypothetical protein EI164_15145, partial [Psychrobacter sp. FME13]|uniref:hypothetical protein n=1 Tax=Psychrobacter sp. FME13 TaxID=2487708 RepID=UPI0017883F6F